MTKRIIGMACIAIAAVVTAPAQNIQLHYDLGHTLYSGLAARPNVTTTFELFKPDSWGSTFMFTDIDYFSDGAAGVYWEFSREIDVSSNKQWALHAEYNGGATTVEHTAIASRFQHAALAGVAWNWAAPDFTKTVSLQALYKHYFHGQQRRAFESFQLTTVWNITFAHGLSTFCGYTDLWYDPSVGGRLVLQSEPQLWLNLSAWKGLERLPLSVGTEVEVSNNFVYDNQGRRNRFYAIPTIGAKWTF
jgi:hypothetical protein